jgi:hypothetical protein
MIALVLRNHHWLKEQSKAVTKAHLMVEREQKRYSQQNLKDTMFYSTILLDL